MRIAAYLSNRLPSQEKLVKIAEAADFHLTQTPDEMDTNRTGKFDKRAMNVLFEAGCDIKPRHQFLTVAAP